MGDVVPRDNSHATARHAKVASFLIVAVVLLAVLLLLLSVALRLLVSCGDGRDIRLSFMDTNSRRDAH